MNAPRKFDQDEITVRQQVNTVNELVHCSTRTMKQSGAKRRFCRDGYSRCHYGCSSRLVVEDSVLTLQHTKQQVTEWHHHKNIFILRSSPQLLASCPPSLCSLTPHKLSPFIYMNVHISVCIYTHICVCARVCTCMKCGVYLHSSPIVSYSFLPFRPHFLVTVSSYFYIIYLCIL